ncbi:MAG: hypothetical protein J5988_04495 [Eubacterium sp.]|nr:hypothetical protein [Eubacterium sp.]
MFDGSLVQNLDTDHVPSRRRNPVIADIFNRMNFMERRGSGFKKIKDDYHKAVNFRSELEPQFYSDATSFWVTLYNLNYKVPIEKVSIVYQSIKKKNYRSFRSTTESVIIASLQTDIERNTQDGAF